jgi:hypothetical protein
MVSKTLRPQQRGELVTALLTTDHLEPYVQTGFTARLEAELDAISAGELEAWCERRRALGLSEDGPLFCTPAGMSITVSMVRDMVRQVMAAAGRPPHLYGAHSLRIGGATAALAAGVPPALIRLMGRWSSDVYEIYCRMSVQAALQVGQAVASAAVSTFEGGFHEEHLELLPAEVELLGGSGVDEMMMEEDGGDDGADEDAA